MPQPRPPYTYHPLPPAEVDAKAMASEAIRAVRVIVDRSQPAETDATVTPCYPDVVLSHPVEGGAPDSLSADGAGLVTLAMLVAARSFIRAGVRGMAASRTWHRAPAGSLGRATS